MGRSADFWISICILAFCGVSASLTMDVPSIAMGTKAGPDFFPWLMIAGLAVGALILMGRALWRQRGAGAAEPRRGPHFNLMLMAKLAGCVVLMLAYAYFYESAGYLLSSSVFFVVAMLALGERSFLHTIIIPACVIGGTYLSFTYLIQVYLP